MYCYCAFLLCTIYCVYVQCVLALWCNMMMMTMMTTTMRMKTMIDDDKDHADKFIIFLYQVESQAIFLIRPTSW